MLSAERISPLLLVEDDIIDAERVRRALPGGVELAVATSVLEARRRLAARRFRCVITDLALPDGDGRAVLAACLALQPAPAVVVLTGLGAQHLSDPMLKAGAQDYLHKDELEGHRLWQAVSNAVGRQEVSVARRTEEQRQAASASLDRLTHLSRGLGATLMQRMQAIELDAASLAVASPALEAVMEELIASAREATALCQGLLTFAEGGPSVGTVDMGQLLTETRGAWTPQLPDAVQMDHWIGAQVPLAVGDPRTLRVAVDRLVENAVEAVGDRGRVHLRVDGVRVHEPGAAAYGLEVGAGRFVALSVHDDGAGIAPSDLGRICDPLFSRRAPDRGWGLAAALGIMRVHRGLLQAASAPGDTCVRLLLPAAT